VNSRIEFIEFIELLSYWVRWVESLAMKIERGEHISYPPKFEDVEAWQRDFLAGVTRNSFSISLYQKVQPQKFKASYMSLLIRNTYQMKILNKCITKPKRYLNSTPVS